MKDEVSVAALNGYLFILAFGIAAGLSVSSAVWFAGSYGETISQFDQPSHVHYRGGPYTIYIQEFKGWRVTQHRLVVGRIVPDGPPDSSPLHIDHNFSYDRSSGDVRNVSAGCSAEWTEDGVTFTDNRGLRLFIPRSEFDR